MQPFEKLLTEYFAAKDKKIQKQAEQKLWDLYGTKGAVLIMDMSGFSLVTQKYGIVYYLSMIYRMQQITRPTIEKHKGTVVKFVADNVFARFDSAADAINAVIEINHLLDIENAKTPDLWDIQVAAGIDYGNYLLTDELDYFGDVVNKASKLGEDIARGGEILITENAYKSISSPKEYKVEPLEFNISGIKLTTFSVLYKDE
ncbi:putative adenylate/guanylate cyclase [Catenovulum agarivorans DS-2]|uniref:Putative adenylate/guanylate cyclase n=1 Tax=Catenovulum agarivorans DS-2 TaxID=1328313 RepID=W7QVC6_9ALTE|nr:adenylate/guanylate cyclase domain-containing protein [Catenovulum agarivorans]EWH09250.1 putative adenylate/guanylate cyclase [Catenovulum agarivorans DS-2]